jgi:hypothetical protein
VAGIASTPPEIVSRTERLSRPIRLRVDGISGAIVPSFKNTCFKRLGGERT